MSSRAKPYSSFSAVLIVSLIYFLRKQQGSSAYLIEIGGSSYTGMFGYLTAFQEMIEQVWAICMEWFTVFIQISAQPRISAHLE